MKLRDIIIAAGIVAASCSPILAAYAYAEGAKVDTVDGLLDTLQKQEDDRQRAAIENVLRNADTRKAIFDMCYERYGNGGAFVECQHGLEAEMLK